MGVRERGRIEGGAEWRKTRWLMRTPSGDEFSGVEHVLDLVQELSGLLSSQPFTIEGIQNLLDQSIRDFGGQVRHRERLAVLLIGGPIAVNSASALCVLAGQ